ncbi:MAG: T9SS type A sorting domain-containing protein, partial [candidate division WOR-3 bacterium]|nr:T9SS type A sorting domain-containing protein [candidate division WOR-3 bacterium]
INVTAVRYTLPRAGPVSFKLYDITGAIRLRQTITNPTKDGVFFIDAKALTSGVYILRFNAGDIRVTKKLVIEK